MFSDASSGQYGSITPYGLRVNQLAPGIFAGLMMTRIALDTLV